MLRNYFKIGLRSLRKQKVYSLINILGLSVGLATVIMIMLHVEDEFSYDNFHANGDRIYKVFLERIYPDHETKYAFIPHSFPEVMVADFPEVQSAVRVFKNPAEVLVSYTDENNNVRSFEENEFMLADSTFFEVFNISLLSGDPSKVLKNPEDIVITAPIAEKYFGDEDPINKSFETDFGNFKVTGVCERIPANSHFAFDFVGNLKAFPFFNAPNFLGFSAHTYLLLEPRADPKVLESKFPAMVEKYAGPELQQNLNQTYAEYVADGNGYNYTLVNVQDIHLNPVKYQGQIKPGGNGTYVFIFISIAIFILAIACINFMNLATARSTERAKEVGIRKTLGSVKTQLIRQFLVESVLISLISLLVALGIVVVALPFFNNVAGKALAMDLTQSFILPGIVLFAILVGLLAGSYPAFILSAFNPAQVLKGNQRTGKDNAWLRNGLVVFQFFISIVLITGTLVVQRQMQFIQNKNLGFNKDNVLIIERAANLQDQVQSFINEAKGLPGVVGAAGSSTYPSSFFVGQQFQIPGSPDVYTTNSHSIDDDFSSLIGYEIVEGRGFSKDVDDSLNIIVNEQTKELLGVEDVIGLRLQQNNGANPPQMINYEIIGVVKDFNYMSLHEKISPLVLFNTESNQGGIFFISVKVNDHYQQVISSLGSRWSELAPGQPFKYKFLDEDLARQYQNEANSGKLLKVFAALGILIACVGLFGLAAYTAGLKTKEIGIRKVMGASVFSVVAMLSRDFTILILISFAIAAPLSWMAMNKWLDSFAYQVTLGVDVFLIAGVAALLIAWLTVSYQSIKAAVVNPINSLRSE